MTFSSSSDEEYGYSLRYPAEWIVEADESRRASFDPRRGPMGATVDVDKEIDLTLAEYVATLLNGLVADELGYVLECLDRRDIALDGRGVRRVVAYTYLSRMCNERWYLASLFVCDGKAGCTVGVDWNDADWLEAIAARIVESFALEAT